MAKVLISEKQIDNKISDSLLEFKDNRCDSIRKIRYYFTYEGEYFNLDVFENNNDIGILEINISSDFDEVLIPDFVSILEKVSNNEMYFNRNIAFKKEQKLVKKND